jgi:heptosyltransferase-2
MTQTIQSIALWQTAFLGDAVLTLPLLHTLADAYPDARIDMYVRKGVEPLFAAQRELQQVHAYAKRSAHKGIGGILAIGSFLREQNYDLLVSAHRSFRSALVAKLSGIQMRVGYDTPLYNKLAYTHPVSRQFDQLAEVERLLRLALPLDIERPTTTPRLDLAPDVEDEVDAFFHTYIGGPCIGLNPGSVWPTKRWPAQYFGEVADTAASQGLRVIIFGGPGEESTARQVIDATASETRFALVNMAGKLTLPELASFISRLDAYLSNDSGPMHIAWTLGTPTVALFGPTVEKLGFFPRGDHTMVLQTELDCRPCGLHGGHTCPQNHHRCMRDITPEMAWNTLQRVMRRPQ